MKAVQTPSLLKKLPITLPFIALLLCGLSLPAQAGTRPAVTRKTLFQPTEIQGYHGAMTAEKYISDRNAAFFSIMQPFLLSRIYTNN